MIIDSLYKRIIADNMKKIRLIHGLTQSQISSRISCNTFTYRGYENLKSNVPIEVLIRLADCYGVSMDYFVGRKPIKTSFKIIKVCE